ncbi:acetylserotonin O-methyltransferase [Nocardia sp. alder85J]|uniref:acetylserotonin O-methyltransferase n=1 Tax=Nocardia sp. alder85J TaxID=2862949 RepID=UPI001CD8173C|nr:acetylserotonin O-methyltransferase [Nocardia sp. alder85J]MCX4095388.1 methyltransferase [Nocardia sp. alder85J]
MERILQLGLAFQASRTLLSAVELDVFTALADGPLPLDPLRDWVGLHPRAARDFLDALVALGMLHRNGGLYSNTTESARYLNRKSPDYLGGYLEMEAERGYLHWGHLTEALCTGRPQNEIKEGGDFFATLYSDGQALRGFLQAMTGLSRPSAVALATGFPWEERDCVADIGTAQGEFLRVVLDEHQRLRGIGFDLPVVEPIFTDHLGPLTARAAFVPGDFLHDPLPTADVLVFGHILHSWDPGTRGMLLRKAYDAVPEGGSVIVYDTLVDDGRRTNAHALLNSLTMLIETAHGSGYTLTECRNWMAEAGFGAVYAQRLTGTESMVCGTKLPRARAARDATRAMVPDQGRQGAD